MQITANEMYPENSQVVDKLLIDMATMPIVKVGMNLSINFIHLKMKKNQAIFKNYKIII